MLYGKFGKSIVEKFLKPYNEKLYATDLTNLDVDAMGRFFPYADKEAIINNMKKSEVNSYNSSFLYPKNGAASFIQVLYDNLDKDKVLLNTSVVKIDTDKKIIDAKGKALDAGKIEFDLEGLTGVIEGDKFIIKDGDNIVDTYTLTNYKGQKTDSATSSNNTTKTVTSKKVIYKRVGGKAPALKESILPKDNKSQKGTSNLSSGIKTIYTSSNYDWLVPLLAIAGGLLLTILILLIAIKRKQAEKAK